MSGALGGPRHGYLGGPFRPAMAGRDRGAVAPVVVSVGGSVLLRGDDDPRFLHELADVLRDAGRSRPVVVTTGGGRTARQYIDLAASLGLTHVEQDELGIDVTRLHARLLAGAIGLPTASHPPTSVREAVEAARHASPVVLGGTEPGHTTDGVAALVAVRLRAGRVVNATDVAGLYEEDPKTHPGARRIDRVGWPRLLDLLRLAPAGEPGQNLPFDRLGAEALARARIPLAIVDGRDLSKLTNALKGKPFDGTLVR